MKKICFYLVMAAAMVGMVSCAPKHDLTIANLKAAINGEATASAKYAAFAEQAAKDSLYSVEALFKAASQAEAIHIKNHQAALAELGVTDFTDSIGTFEVKSTAENLQAAIDGETYEFENMYPGFIKDADKEKVQNAVVSFNYAQDAEKKHAQLYQDALAGIQAPDSMATTYYLCPKCGNIYATTAAEACELCQTPADQFVVFTATVPAAAEAAPAEATPAKK